MGPRKFLCGRAFERAGHTRAKGSLAEAEAVRWLERHGYRVVATNFQARIAEIDVIAVEEGGRSDPDVLCFVEIKARRSDAYGPAIGSVTPDKQERIATAASLFLARNAWNGPCRFDVLALDRQGTGWRFTLLRDAFSLP